MRSVTISCLLPSILLTSPAWAQSTGNLQAGRPLPVNGSAVQDAPGLLPTPLAGDSGDIIVTAQKRSESINTVPMSITALAGDQLIERGIQTAADLRRVVPSFNFAETTYGTPVFTLRGIGFYENALAASPAVGVYVDQVPLPFSAMTRLASFDLERVEVLKGPQGTLFGANATGGAINYIAAKPTNSLSAGFNVDLGRFENFLGEGFISGPISPTLSARLSIRSNQSGPWQDSLIDSRELGRKNDLAGRLLLAWQPSSPLTVNVSLSAWKDQSDTQALQVLLINTLNPAACNPMVPVSCTLPGIVNEPRARNARDANWGINGNAALGDPAFRRDDHMTQASARIDYDFDRATLTSITGYARYRQNALLGADGTSFNNLDFRQIGGIDNFSQELRIASSTDRTFRWVVGANYQDSDVRDGQILGVADGSPSVAISPLVPFFSNAPYGNTKVKSYAAFLNGDYVLSDRLVAHAGVRYTDVHTANVSGIRDSGDGSTAAAFSLLQSVLNGSPGTIAPGGDIVLTIRPDATSPTGIRATPGPVFGNLNEDNIGWRLGLDYSPGIRSLIYANVSRGYKAGSFPFLAPATSIGFRPAKQENLIAYEFGFKQRLGLFQINAAAFYYDYTDKQVRGRIIDPIFGPLDAEINVPKSRLYGLELETSLRPIGGITGSVGFTYLNSKVSGRFANFDPFGNQISFKGLSFPFTPKYSVIANVNYDLPTAGSLRPFVGASVAYQSSISTAFVRPEVLGQTVTDLFYNPGATAPADLFKIDGYAVVDLRAGIRAQDDGWRVSLWVRNLTDKYYLTNIVRVGDTTTGSAGMPRTFGISLAFRMR